MNLEKFSGTLEGATEFFKMMKRAEIYFNHLLLSREDIELEDISKSIESIFGEKGKKLYETGVITVHFVE